MRARIQPARILVIVLEALAIALVLLYLEEYFGWRWVREASGLDLGPTL